MTETEFSSKSLCLWINKSDLFRCLDRWLALFPSNHNVGCVTTKKSKTAERKQFSSASLISPYGQVEYFCMTSKIAELKGEVCRPKNQPGTRDCESLFGELMFFFPWVFESKLDNPSHFLDLGRKGEKLMRSKTKQTKSL